jgi:hypothetical protein
VPYTGGSQQVTLTASLADCLADDSRLGARDGCSMYVGAALLADTSALADSSNGDPLARAFDERFPIGPFVVGAGRAPTIPPIDLSASRFGVVQWASDDALRLGGAYAPLNITGPITGVPQSGGGATIIVPTIGPVYSPPTGSQPQQQGAYPQLAFLENGAWRRAIATSAPAVFPGGSSSVNYGFTGVAAFATNDVYTSHATGLYHYDGSAFTRITTIPDSLLSVSSVNGAGGKLVIAGGPNGAVWIGNTQTWTKYSIGTSQRIDGVCITGPNEAFAASFTGGGLWRFNGSAWTAVPASTSVGKLALQCPAPGQAFVMGQGATGGLFTWTGSGWSLVPATGLNPNRLVTWGVVSGSEIYAWGDSASTDRAFYRFDGTAWIEVGRRRFTQSSAILNGIMWADPRGGAAYVVSGFGRVERVTPSGTTVLSYQPALRDISMSSTSSAFVVGWNLFLARWDGAKWTVDAPPGGTPSVRVLQGVWSDGPSNAWAVGNASTILRYDGTGWSVVSDATHPVGPSDSYNAVWGSGSNVWIVGNTTILRCGGAGGCAAETGSPGTLYSVWGTADGSTRFAVGAGGRIVTASGTGGWQPMTSPTSRTLVRVAGSSATDVWAVGDSVLLHYNGASWANVPMVGDLYSMQTHAPSVLQALFQVGLWVRSADEAYLGSDFGSIARYDSRAQPGWSQVNGSQYFARRILSIAGLAGGCALAVNESQTDSPQPTLWRGAGPSGCFLNPMTAPTSWP